MRGLCAAVPSRASDTERSVSKLSHAGLATGTRAWALVQEEKGGSQQTRLHQPQEERRTSSVGLRT